MNCSQLSAMQRLLLLGWFLALFASQMTNPLTTWAQSGPGVNATTFHYDSLRTGWNPNETLLTPSNVSGPNFGPLWNSPLLDSVTINGISYPPHLYATPLYVDSVQITAGPYAGYQFSVVFAATTNDYVYAINAGAETFCRAGR